MDVYTLISYEGKNIQDLTEDFHNAVDDDLQLCIENEIAPE